MNVIITGGTTGIGLSVVKEFAGNGYNVISISRNFQKANYENENVEYYFCDVSDNKALLSVCEKIESKYHSIDVLVNNAGTIIPGGIEKLTVDEWETSINNNLSSYFIVTKAFLPLLKKCSNSSVINISSISAKLGGSSVAYSVAKAGVDMFTKVAAREFAVFGIRVNTVAPGIVNSGFQVANGIVKNSEYDEFLNTQASAYPLGIGDVSEISNAIYFLASEQAKWITGTTLTVDGGRSINL